MTATGSCGSGRGARLVRRALIGVACAVLWSSVRLAWSASGDLDTTFGSGGQVTLRFSSDAGSPDIAAAVIAQPDGKLIVGGTKDWGRSGTQMVLARLNADGSLDATFGTGGSTTPIDGELSAVARQSDGKLVAVGSVTSGVVVARYNTNGVLDTAGFGAPGGVVTTQLPGSSAVATSVAIAPDGKIVVAGLSYDAAAGGYDVAVLRLNANGSLDGTFGAAGKVMTDVGGRDDAAFAVAVQPDGKVVVAGHTFNSLTNGYDIALVRYDTNGFPDGGFGTAGKVMTDLGTRDDRAFGLVVQPDGKLVAAGQAFGFDLLDVALVRYQASGAVDATFGSAGKAVLAVSSGHDAARAVALQGDGKLVVAGYANAATSSDLAAARFNPDGNADVGFGAGGKVVTAAGTQADEALSVAIQPDGKIVAAGRTKVPFNGTFGGTDYQDDFLVVRYLP